MPKSDIFHEFSSHVFLQICKEWKAAEMESDESFKAGRFNVSVIPPPAEQQTSIGRIRLIPQGSPSFLQRGRFSVIPEEESTLQSPSIQTKLSGPKIVVDPSPEWDFLVSFTFYQHLQGLLFFFTFFVINFKEIDLKPFSFWFCQFNENLKLKENFQIALKRSGKKDYLFGMKFTEFSKIVNSKVDLMFR